MNWCSYATLLMFLILVKTVWLLTVDQTRTDDCKETCKTCRKKGKKCICKKKVGVVNSAYCVDQEENNKDKEDELNTASTSQSLVEESKYPCQSNPCHHGTCITSSNKNEYKCKCGPGYDPKNKCQPCKKSFGKSCKHQCYNCHPPSDCHHVTGCRKCKYGFINSKKNIQDCKNVNCLQNPCENGGECRKKSSGSYCACPVDAEGILCADKLTINDIPKCEANPDKLRLKCIYGECYMKGKNQMCLCQEGWAGKHCHKKCKTSSQNCVHGHCDRDKKKEEFTCVCNPGWKSHEKSSYCDVRCDEGTWGVECKEKCGHCTNQPCDHFDGSCLPGGCVEGYTGERCDEPLDSNTNNSEETKSFAGTGAAEIRGTFNFTGVYPPTRQKEKKLKKETKAFVKTTGRRALLQQTVRGLQASVKLGRGSVIVDFTLFVPSDVISGQTNIRENMVQGLKQNAGNFKSSVGNYTVDLASIKVTSVVATRADNLWSRGGTLTIALSAFGAVLLLVASIAIIIRKLLQQRRTLPAVHPTLPNQLMTYQSRISRRRVV